MSVNLLATLQCWLKLVGFMLLQDLQALPGEGEQEALLDCEDSWADQVGEGEEEQQDGGAG